MKKFVRMVSVSFALLGFTVSTACSEADPLSEEQEITVQPGGEENENSNTNNEEQSSMNSNLTITVGSLSFTASLADNDAVRAFAALLPLTVQMNELNDNEKYCYLETSLPTDSYRPGRIEAGDLMLYGSSCVVLFYESFSSSYSYTRIGKIDHPEGLAAAVGDGTVSVTFSLQ